MSYPKKYASFTNREGRAAFLAREFASELASSSSILDVGCDYNSLKKIVGSKVTGVDLYGEPDIRIDFEKDALSQFDDNAFDFIVCTEVLEHLDNLHLMVDELFRVSNRYVLISLPNSLSVFAKWNIVFRDTAGKYYGLPHRRPEDRHRWFFSYKDIDAFFRQYASDHEYELVRRFLLMNFSSGWRGSLMRFFIRTFGINNASASYWLLLEKPHGN